LRLDLLRHGDALAVAVGVSDDQRPLSPRGIADVERLGRRLAAQGWKPDLVLASPLLRARDTAERVLRASGIAAPLRILEVLDPSTGAPEDVIDALADLDPSAHVLLVGHQPLLGLLGLRLSGTETRFSPATFARFESPGGPAPGAFRRIEVLHPESNP
jgi:phosphohistidine phosphatase SixA